MKELLIDSFKDALFDTVKLIPFLLITYVVWSGLREKKLQADRHMCLERQRSLGH